ncbi:hypothetical protein RB599_001113 [Gaeumannomyces hyphopodioides]
MIMGGAADTPQRSSSPLKRRASSMDQEMDSDAKEDVDMINPPPLEEPEEAGSLASPPRQDDAGAAGVISHAPNPASDPKLSASEGPGTSAPTEDGVSDLGIKTGFMHAGAPPLPEQIKTIETLLKAFGETPLQEGDTAYLVSRQWLEKAQAFGDDSKHAPTKASEVSLGPVDNSDIVQEIVKDVDDKDFVRLKPGLGLEHYQLFSQDAWDLVVSWYGLADGQLPIQRFAHDTAPEGSIPHVQFEIHPPIFAIHRLWSPTSPIPIDQKLKAMNPPPATLACSSSCRTHAFLKKIKRLAGVELDRKVRLWRVTREPLAPASTPPSSSAMQITPATPPESPNKTPDERDPWDYLLVEASRLMALSKNVEREELEIKDTTHDANYNGRSTLAFYSLHANDTLVLDENIQGHLFVSVYKGTGVAPKEKAIATKGSLSSLAVTTRATASGRSSPAPIGPTTRGRAKLKSGRTTGCVGLSNLGNTCYMNSALQCVRSVEELTKYFLVGEAEKEINTDNPLAHNGDVAMVYYSLLKEMYKDSASASFSPRQFKNVVGRYAPAFSGYGQQDSQEFVGFLLDALQEDLSRIKKKPYIEKPDSTDDMINNPDAIKEMADKVWDITKKRDDSVIADLFTGMYKSTLVCPFCDKVSITFDPFNNLTLPLPLQNVWTKAVKYVPLNDAPVEINVELDKNSSIKELKDYIAARVGVPPERLTGAEEFKDKFFKIYEDNGSASEDITTNDVPVFFELEAAPTNLGYKRPKKKITGPRSMLQVNDEEDDEAPAEWDAPAADRLAVPVIHKFGTYTNGRKRQGITVTPPHFIVVTREEARSEDAIRRKILEKVASFSTWPQLSHSQEAGFADNTDLEMVTAPTSDADSSGDSKVIAKSVEGEEDLVDVSTATAGLAGAVPGPAAQSIKPLKVFNTARPKWIDSSEYLDPQLQNLFSLSYFSESESGIPTGWQSVNDNMLPSLASRLPQVDVDMRSPGATGPEHDSSSEESSQQAIVDPVETAELTRMAEESSDEDDTPPNMNVSRLRASQKPKMVGGRRQNRKPQKTYGKKSGKRRSKHSNSSSSSAAPFNSLDNNTGDSGTTGSNSGPLIRLGEGIVVYWDEDAWEMVYGKAKLNDGRGEPTFTAIETLQDPALAERKRLRAQRRKNGITLDDCLDEFEKQEILSEQDMWYCPRCKEHRRAKKKFDLWKTPDILVVHLKRFSSSGWRRDKLDILVDFPIEGLDLTRRVIDRQTNKQEVYDLIAIDDHWGGLGGGHYTAFAKNFIDNEWYDYNDSSVTKQKDPSRMVTSSAYLLFYRRRSDIPLGGPRFQRINDLFNNDTPDEDMSDSGEGQRLDTGSSPRGSSSALIGAEVTHPQGGRGSPSGVLASEVRGLSADDGEQLPSYEQTVGAGPMVQSWQPGENDDGIRGSIEDEGIGMATNQWAQSDWNWNHIEGGPKTTGSVASDEAEMNSSNGGFSDRNTGMNSPFQQFDDYDDAPAPEGPVSEYQEPPEPNSEAQANMNDIRNLSWKNQGLHTIPADIGEDAASVRAIEIHLDDEKSGKTE